MSDLKISELTFKSGEHSEGAPVSLEPGTVTILVGPNNSGKSLFLQELFSWLRGEDQVRLVIQDIKLSIPDDADDAIKMLEGFSKVDNNSVPPTLSVANAAGTNTDVFTFDLDNFRHGIVNKVLPTIRQTLTKSLVVKLDGLTRLQLIDQKTLGDRIEQPPNNHLWSLFVNDKERAQVSKMVHNAFNRYFVLDAHNTGSVRIRLSANPPADNEEELGGGTRSREFHSKAALITEFSDGVKAYTGLTSAIAALPHKFILVDEPEAFLHPTLAKRLGNDLSSIAKNRKGNLFVATHSPEFLLGCLEATNQVNIVRLTYQEPNATTRKLNHQKVEELMQKPILRSSRVFSGLFHKAVIVSEADADRAFYEEINTRLVATGRGVSDALFVNAQNWMTIADIIKPLRDIGVPAAAVIDLDAIKESANQWKKFYDAVGLTDTDRDEIEAERAICAGYLAAKGKVAYKAGGVAAFVDSEKRELLKLIKKFKLLGLFIVDVGELERWLPSLGVTTTDKKRWITRIFQALGSDPSDRGYIKPRANDVWRFIDEVAVWILESTKRGVS